MPQRLIVMTVSDRAVFTLVTVGANAVVFYLEIQVLYAPDIEVFNPSLPARPAIRSVLLSPAIDHKLTICHYIFRHSHFQIQSVNLGGIRIQVFLEATYAQYRIQEVIIEIGIPVLCGPS